MKRKDMVKLMHKYIEQESYQDYAPSEEILNELLAKIEAAGMLPPQRTSNGWDYENEWEVDDA